MSFPEEEPKPEEPISPEEIPSAETPFPEEPISSEEAAPTEATFAEEPDLPDGFTPLGATAPLPRARRRRAHRMLAVPSADERANILDTLARRAFPSFEFFLFALLCGAILGAAYLLDSPALLLLGSLLAPLLTPWVGMVLAIQTGSWRFFFLTLGGLLVASLLVFSTGALAGLAGRLWLPLPLFHAGIHSHLWWPDLFLVVLGAVLLTISFVRSEHRPILPSVMLAYGLFLPLSAAGVWLGIGGKATWNYGLAVFLVHLALAILAGIITLAALRFKPAKAGGYVLSFLVGILCLATLVYFTGSTTFIRDQILATRRIVPTPTLAVLPSITATSAPTPTASPTATETATPSPSATPQPTPAYAIITSPEGGGAAICSKPGGGEVVAVLINSTILQVLPEVRDVNGRNWVHILWGNVDGWVLQTAITATTATPPPPTLAPTSTP